MSNQLTRQWHLLKLIESGIERKKSTQQLYQAIRNEYPVSKKTIERDLCDLEENELFSIAKDSEGAQNFWYWTTDAKVWLPGLTPHQALAFVMLEKHMKELLPEDTLQELESYFAAAKAELDEMEGLGKIMLPPQTYKHIGSFSGPQGQVFDNIYHALNEQKAVALRTCHKANPAITVVPLTWLLKGRQLYLIYWTSMKVQGLLSIVPFENILEARYLANQNLDPNIFGNKIHLVTAHERFSSKQYPYDAEMRHKLVCVQEAIANYKKITLALDTESGLITVNPLALLKRGNPYYLIYTHEGDQQIRIVPLSELAIEQEGQPAEGIDTDKGIRSWSNKFRLITTSQRLFPAELSTDVSQVVNHALLHDEAINIVFRNRAQTETYESTIFPLALAQRGTELYLVYVEVDRPNDVKFMPLYRIKQAKKHFAQEQLKHQYPKNFDIDRYLETGALSFGATYPIKIGAPLQLDALFSVKAGQRLLETPISQNQTHEKLADGRYRISANVKFTGELLWWLLSYGSSVEVKGPPELRQLVKDNIMKLSECYGAD